MIVEWVLGLLASILVALLTAYLTTRRELRRLKEQMKLDYSIEAAIVHLLRNPDYKKRSLRKIKHHLRGFASDDDLRMALIRAGAVAFGGEGEQEMWGLLARNEEDVK